MKINIPVKETIKKRVSTRTYTSEKLSKDDKDKLLKAISELNNPFGENVKIQLVEKDTVSNGEKLGTYGVIKGAHTFLGVTTDRTELAPLAAGYQFENLILIATNMGLSTVWLAATFSREQFEKAMNIGKDEVFPAISPIGYATGKKSITESIMRKAMSADKRKPWEEMFFKDSFETPITKEDAKEYRDSLEMLRLAPSAKNAQPWRIVQKDGSYHFFIIYKGNISKEEKFIKEVDLGIGLSHFHQAALENGLDGEFVKLDAVNIDIPENTKYIISWKING